MPSDDCLRRAGLIALPATIMMKMNLKKTKIAILLAMLFAAANVVAQDGVLSDGTERQRESREERRARRGLVEMGNVFVPKGQWIFGGTASYSTHDNNQYKLLLLEDINSTGYTVKVSPMVAYAVADNMAVGGRFNYDRTFMRIDSASLSFGDEETGTHISTDFYYALKHSYSAGAIWRQYIPLGANRRFALFNEVQLSMGASRSKFATDSPVRGTFSKSFDMGLSINPGVIAFATNVMAVEVNVGVMGLQFSHTKQVHNQVATGKSNASFMNFSVNLFSIGLGVSFYM